MRLPAVVESTAPPVVFHAAPGIGAVRVRGANPTLFAAGSPEKYNGGQDSSTRCQRHRRRIKRSIACSGNGYIVLLKSTV